MMYRAAIVTPWVAAADDPSPVPSNHPLLGDEYDVLKWEDISGTPAENLTPAPNEMVVLCECEESVLAAIDLDADYDVLWSEEIVEVAP